MRGSRLTGGGGRVDSDARGRSMLFWLERGDRMFCNLMVVIISIGSISFKFSNVDCYDIKN